MRFSSIIWVVIVMASAAMLYSVKYQVQAMDEEIAMIRRDIDRERASLQVLQAEWAFLSRPDRIRQLANKHLDVAPVAGSQLMDIADIQTLGESDVTLAGSDEGQGERALKAGIMPAGGAGYAR